VLPALFIVSQVDFINRGDWRVPLGSRARPRGDRATRRWQEVRTLLELFTRVGENPRYPTICERCSEAIAEIEATLAGAH